MEETNQEFINSIYFNIDVANIALSSEMRTDKITEYNIKKLKLINQLEKIKLTHPEYFI